MTSDNFRLDDRLSPRASAVYQFIVEDYIARTEGRVVVKYIAIKMGEDIDDLEPFIDELIVAGYLEPTSFSGILTLTADQSTDRSNTDE